MVTTATAGRCLTFDRIWENLQSLRGASGDFRVIVRLHVDVETQASAPAFIDHYRQSFGGDRRFRLFIRPLSRLGRPGSDGPPLLDPEAGREIVRRLRQLAANKGIGQFGLEKVDAICYASRANSYVVRADGRLNKCSLDLEDPQNQVGRIRSDGTLEIDQSKLWDWLRGVWTNDRETLRCPRRGLRAEGEPVSWPAQVGVTQVPLAPQVQASTREEPCC